MIAKGPLTMQIRAQYIRMLIHSLIWALATVHASTPAQGGSSDVSELPDPTSCAIELGLSPASLVVTEIVGQDTTVAEAILQRLDQADQLRTTLASLHDEYDALGQELMAIAGALHANPDSGDSAEDYSLIVTQLEDVEAQIALLRNELITVALEDCTSAQIQAMETWRSSQSYDVPASFRVTIRDDVQWRTIAQALRAERRAIRHNEPFTGPLSDVLTTVRSEPAVIAAEDRLTLYFTNVEQIFVQYESHAD